MIGTKIFLTTWGATLFIQACTILQGVLVARLLGPVGRGEYAAIILWPSLFAAIGIIGSNITIARTAAKGVESGSLFRTAVVIGVVTATLTSLLCCLALPWLIPQTQRNILFGAQLFVPFILLNHITLNLLSIDQGSGDFNQFNFVRSMLYPVYIGLIIVSWLAGRADAQFLAVALLVANAVAFLYQLGSGLKRHALIGPLYSIKTTFRESLHFGLAGICMPFYQQADKALVLWLLDCQNLGFYTVALSASGVVDSVTSSMGLVAFTAAARTNIGSGFEYLLAVFRISVVLRVVFGILLFVAMGFLLPLVYGGAFGPAIQSARTLIIGSTFAGLANLLEQSMRGQGRAFVGLEGRLAGLVVMVLAGWGLAKTNGLDGVCMAYAVSQLVCLVVIMRRLNQHYSAKGWKHYMPRWNDVWVIWINIKRVVHGFRSRAVA